jgi:hypothetical protein
MSDIILYVILIPGILYFVYQLGYRKGYNNGVNDEITRRIC